MTTTTRITAEQLLELPDDGFRYELLRGDLHQMSPAGDEHGEIAMHIGGNLWHHVSAYRLGKAYAAETGFVIARDPDTVRAPDAAFICQQRLDEMGLVSGYRPGAPALVAELLSPSDTYTYVQEKAMEWLEAGTRMVVVVNPRRQSVTVYRSLSDIVILTGNDVLDGGEVAPGGGYLWSNCSPSFTFRYGRFALWVNPLDL